MNKYFKTSLLAASVGAASLSASSVFAAGFQLSEHSASALGRANAGAASYADNAAILARNPAASTSFENVELSITLHHVDPDVDVKGKNTISPDLVAYLNGLAPTQGDQVKAGYDGYMQAKGYSEDASATDVAPNALIPGFYVAIPVNENLAFGVSANSYFGLSSDFGNSYNGSEHAGETSIETMYLTPSIAYKISDSISIGLGLQYIHGTGKLNSYASEAIEAVTTVTAGCFPNPAAPGCNSNKVVTKGDTLLDLEGDGDGFGFQLGLMWDITESSSIGFRYQSEVEMEFDGDIEYLPLAATNTTGNKEADGSMSVDLPEMMEIGYSNQLTDKWAIHGTILYTGWSSFENLTADIDAKQTANLNNTTTNPVDPNDPLNPNIGKKVGEVHLKEEMWEDTFSYSIGADYTLNELTTLRAGIAFDESPVADEHRSLTIPDSDRLWYSIGATVKVGNGGSIDASLLFIQGQSADVNETFYSTDLTQTDYPTTPLTEFDGELGSVGATIFSLAYNHKF